MNARPDLPAATRPISYRTSGRTGGGVTRLVSPGDLGQHIKPFVFVDLFELASSRHKMGMHPHSGIATVTVILDGALEYRESTGSHGMLPAGGIEWMRAGGGVWHEGGPAAGGAVTGFQLWLALPPEDENGPAQSIYLAPEQVPSEGPARVVIGRHGTAASPIAPRAPINYLHVTLRDGETWRYQPPAGHDVAWVAVGRGAVDTAGTTLEREVAVFEQGSGELVFTARGKTEFVLGSAPRHPHDLVTGYYSVHTSQAALERGEREIARIGARLRAGSLL
ncbi:pirin family protein [Massilia sp. YMA4]|uniref:pirin family protein n=1 Tax=Massilia sp. YMA4 TaxID=1593482 RepID=UPI000DD0F7BE|nr:pirin family protein [Massilia sp. YMA4]AXA94159.1 pirin family protein [Massilia sp. YMA4]